MIVVSVLSGRTYEVEEHAVGLGHERQRSQHVEGQEDNQVAEDKCLRADPQAAALAGDFCLHSVEEDFETLDRVKDFVIILFA